LLSNTSNPYSPSGREITSFLENLRAENYETPVEEFLKAYEITANKMSLKLISLTYIFTSSKLGHAIKRSRHAVSFLMYMSLIGLLFYDAPIACT
jgi:hypothetical protein